MATLDDIASDPVLRKIKKRKKSILSGLKMGGLCISGHCGLDNGVKITIHMVLHCTSKIISKLLVSVDPVLEPSGTTVPCSILQRAEFPTLCAICSTIVQGIEFPDLLGPLCCAEYTPLLLLKPLVSFMECRSWNSFTNQTTEFIKKQD